MYTLWPSSVVIAAVCSTMFIIVLLPDLGERPLRVKMLEEMIPESYETLRRFIESYNAKVPVVQKETFR